MLRLVARHGNRIRLLPLPAGEAVLGSAAGNDLVLPFPGVSRRHARLRPIGRDLLLVDLDSKNGLVCAGKRLPQVLLSPGQEIHLGRVSLTIETADSSEAELGLAFGEAPAGISVSRTSTVLLEPPVHSAGAALRFIREMETAGGALEMAKAREILNARSLLVFRVAGDDILVMSCYGEAPSEPLARALAVASPDGGTRHFEECTVLLGASGKPGVPCLAAVLHEDRSPSGWQEDFFAYLARHLGAAGPAPVEKPASEPVLRLPSGMVLGESPASVALRATLEAAVRSGLDVLLLGETGTGKEPLARAIHASGPTANGPFVAINCAALPADLVEAELFGVQARVATGVDPRPGLFAQAHGGSIFLDEIGELPKRLQAKLLRVLQEREVLPLGASKPKKIETQVVSASNRDLPALAASGRFRADLYYRLRGFEVRVPPLRERLEDLPRLLEAFIIRAAERTGKHILGVSRRALSLLLAHSWPGNVRELEDEVERAVSFCPDGGALESEHFTMTAAHPPETIETVSIPSPAAAPTLEERIDALEREALLAALAASGGNKTRAAQALGLTRNGLNLKLKRLGIDRSTTR